MVQLVFLIIVVAIGIVAYKELTHAHVPNQLEKKKKELKILEQKKELLNLQDDILIKEEENQKKLKDMEDRYDS